ncbi:Two-component sensor histidine kinase, contains HisKA and HATPase domains [Rhizobium sp. NFR07]|uniref:HWE histidine kinase domain-containing protein n=1 Tax=Rhizobium sp. NFR07 TaxID=1566262 RepID=UPI0008EC3466|nr:HWE histidine kinase domain-containing protein [Rhizobium sp. NFR07]SFB57313.1 Two-component sensor histidine kinase, contains HisKA and HATPase domains [Rhizobium sp. NFR07]
MMLEDLYRLLRSGHVQAQGVVDTMTQAVVVLDQRFYVTTANNAFIKTFQVERDDLLGQSLFDLGNGQWDIPELRELIAGVIPKAAAVIGFEVKHDFPGIGQRTFLIDARRLVHPDDSSTNILVMFDDVTERQRHDAEMDFILSETRHRMKNLFAVVRALALQTEVEGQTAADYRQTFLGRLDVTLRAQEIAARNEKTDLQELVAKAIGEAWNDRISYNGPAVQLGPSKILAASMIFHELATNAVKYGALSASEGRVLIYWTVEEGLTGKTYLNCRWSEQNGPAVQPPRRKGYGTEMIEGTAAHLGGGVELSYPAEGLTATIRIPL